MVKHTTPTQSSGRLGRLRCCQALVLCLTAPLVASAEVFMARATSVSDGDTLWVQPADGSAARKLRLQGMDAPEICQRAGPQSRAALQALVASAPLRVTVQYYDVYGRGLARIQVRQRDVGALMVRSGHAWSYRWRRNPGPYAVEEAAARQARAGLFAQKTPEPPGDFRKRNGSCYQP